MEMEYRDPSKRGRWIVVIGVVLALAAGGAAFFLINQAQQQAGQGGLQKVDVVVAARPIPARKPIEAEDVAVREVPLDPTNAEAIVVSDARQGHRPGPRGDGPPGPDGHDEPARRRGRPAASSRSSSRARPSPPTPRRGGPSR